MRLILTLAASLLAGTALAQTSGFGTISGGGGASAGAVAGAGEPSIDPVAETNDDAPGLLGTDVVADPGASPGTGDTGAAIGTAIPELPIRSGDSDSDAGLDAGLDVGVGDTDADGDATAGGPVLGEGTVGEGTVGEATIVEADGPVLVVPDDGDEAAVAVDEPANRLTEGVGGDVDPKTIEVGAGVTTQ